MYIPIQNNKLFCYTGGKPFDAAKPTLVFIHGVVNDHSVWILQTRYFAHHGFNVLAVDLPGHGKSEGNCPKSVEEAAAFILALMDAAGVKKATLIGHSWGSLIALHAASLAPERVSQLALVGTAFPMKVSPALLDTSLNSPMKAIEMVNTFSHSSLSPPPSALGPGTWLYGASRALMRRVLASNSSVNLFHHGFSLCDSYAGGQAAAHAVGAAKVPVQFILGAQDQMTPPKAAASLQAALPGSQTTMVQSGHSLMSEAPEAVLAALKSFVTTQEIPVD